MFGLMENFPLLSSSLFLCFVFLASSDGSPLVQTQKNKLTRVTLKGPRGAPSIVSLQWGESMTY